MTEESKENKPVIGRPKKYTQEFLKNEADALWDWTKKKDSIFYKTFAIERDYSPARFSEFCEESEYFSEVFDKVRAWQEQKLVIHALFNKTNFAMTKMLLAKMHGYQEDKQTIIVTSDPLQCLIDKAAGQSRDLTQK